MIIKRPIITEKSMKLALSNLYVFEVDKNATKLQIGKRVAEKFKVKLVELWFVLFVGELIVIEGPDASMLNVFIRLPRFPVESFA